ncbi:MAG: hypothetical protein LQ351_005611 [Letrouitia transgressa]|nr:MAG: hypothetical protein LQ351_005611 [Letrouitia transgressa]
MASIEVQRRVSGEHPADSSTDQPSSLPAQETVPGLVEMTQLQPQAAAQRNITTPTGLEASSAIQTSTSTSDLPQQHADEGTLATPSVEPPDETALLNSPDRPNDPKIIPPVTFPREKSTPVVSPLPDNSIPSPKELDLSNPSLLITLLLINGVRHPIRIDERFMTKRNIKVDSDNPVNMSVYTLKELIWREWRDGKPSRSLPRNPALALI